MCYFFILFSIPNALYNIHNKFLRESTETKFIASLGFLSTFFCSSLLAEFFKIKFLDSSYDPFFQYYPLRVIFPVLSIYITWKYFNKEGFFLYYSSFIIYSISVLWNFDTGSVVFLSWILILIYKELKENNLKRGLKKILKHLLTGGIMFIVTVFIYAFYIKLRYGSFPVFIGSFKYQSIFYLYGYFMEPMKIIHPWNLVILIYLTGLSYGVRSLFDKEKDVTVYSIVFLSVLGLGLFTYFQGRSHDLSLPGVSYPALLILTVFTDRIFRNRTSLKLISLFLLSWFLFFLCILMSQTPSVCFSVKDKIEAIIEKVPTKISRDAGFLMDHTKQKEKLLILSCHCAIYYNETQTLCALNIPSMTEFFYKDDYNIIYKFIKESEHGKVFLDNTFINIDFRSLYTYKKEKKNIILDRSDDMLQEKIDIVYILLREYNINGISPDGTMIFFMK